MTGQTVDEIAVGDSATHMQTWTLAQYRRIPKTLDAVPDGAASMVIIPAEDSEELHDSGFRCVTLVFFGSALYPNGGPVQHKMLGRTQHGHDHLQFFPNPQSAGRGYGPVTASGYEEVEMDCLPVSGLLRVWLGTNNGLAPSMLFSTATFRPNRTGPDLEKIDLRPDQMKDVKRKMMEWATRFDHATLAVALDEAMGMP